MGELADEVRRLPVYVTSENAHRHRELADRIARLEQENDLLRAIDDATGDIPSGKYKALDNAINALLDWREANRHG